MTIQTLRVTTEQFLPDSEIRKLLGLELEDIILGVKRCTVNHQAGKIDLQGFLVTVLRGQR